MDYIGRYTKQYESGNTGSLTFSNCGNDWGLSCGSYQLTLRWGNCIKFLKKYFPDEAEILYYKGPDKSSSSWPGALYCSRPDAVKRVWKKCYEKIGADEFFKYEYEFIKEIYYNPIKQQISSWIDLDNSSRAFQECFWSWSVHRGPGGALKEFKEAVAAINISTIDHEKLFDLLYDKRYNLVQHNRYKKGYKPGEREQLRSLLCTPGINVYKIISPSIITQKGAQNMSNKLKYTDANPPIQCMMTDSTCYKGTTEMQVVGILFHSTGANNPTLKRYVQPSKSDPKYQELLNLIGVNQYNNSWNQITHYAGLNAWIGKLADGSVTTLQTMPWNFRPWGCGSGQKGSCNTGWIQFEICEDGLTDSNYFDKVYEEACQLSAYLCKKYNIDPRGYVTAHDGTQIPTILCHADAYTLGYGSNHGDVNHWFPKFNKSMATAREDIADLLKESDTPTTNIMIPSVGDTTTSSINSSIIITDEEQEKFNIMMNNYLVSLAKKDSTWEKAIMSWAVEEGLLQGDEHGFTMPKKFITRGEVMTVLQRFKDRFCK